MTSSSVEPTDMVNYNCFAIGTSENSDSQEKIAVITDLISDVLPGLGTFTGELLLFPYLINSLFVRVSRTQ